DGLLRIPLPRFGVADVLVERRAELERGLPAHPEQAPPVENEQHLRAVLMDVEGDHRRKLRSAPESQVTLLGPPSGATGKPVAVSMLATRSLVLSVPVCW